jgi:transglutaminase-like putative cysteine protease
LPGILTVRTERPLGLRYLSSDESLQTSETLNTILKYDVVSTNQPARPDLINNITRQLLLLAPDSDPKILTRIRDYTLRPDVAGPLAAQRSRIYAIQNSNEEIARTIERHLKSSFTYTLDLTDFRAVLKDGDPVYNFLTKVKRGHCEYFASAMTLMCQSIGIPARMVVGFRCDADAYNVYSKCYVVRQTHAHAWVEVLTPRGWLTFDPTTGREDRSSQSASLWQSLKQLFDFFEYKWAEHVVAYDTRDRDDVVRSLDNALTQSAITATGRLAEWRRWLDGLWTDTDFWTGFYRTFFNFLSLLITLMALTILVAIIWYLVSRHRLLRRAHRIGFGALPGNQQIRLARQLAFYDLLTRVLHRHQIIRPAHLTPREFADTLVFLPQQHHLTISRLTRLFYHVRFGTTELNPHRQRRLEDVVFRLADALDKLLPHRRRHRQTR